MFSSPADSEWIFEEVYRKGIWGTDPAGYGTSGHGSSLERGLPFIRYIQDFLKKQGIQSIVDVGCGDWNLSKEIDWGNREYFGIDVVKTVIERNKKAYGKATIHFLHLNAAVEPIPKGDLLICKDVLHHLSDECTYHILSESKKFTYCIFVNDIHPTSDFTLNSDIPIGEYRLLDLTCHPFNLQADAVSTYPSGASKKQIVLIKNSIFP